MAKRKIKVDLSSNGIDRLIEEIRKAENEVKDGCSETVRKLSESASEDAEKSFSVAEYNGENDVKVEWDEKSPGKCEVVATGDATLFIEFGTGVTYPDSHPEKPQGISGRGKYGKGNGKRKSWGYYGEVGNIPPVRVRSTPKGTLVVTKGNPANASMYNAKKKAESDYLGIVKEVFGNG